jgi:uncharacterized protein YndB with AHSA1/START domain
MERRADLVLDIERAFRTHRQAVFKAVSEPQSLSLWWGPEGFRTPHVEFEPRVGARYRIEMQPPSGDPFDLTGEFREVDPPARLAYTFVWNPPDPDDVETVAALSLRDRGDWTDVILTQGPFKTDARRGLHRQGWTEAFDKLERLLSRPMS